MRVRRTPRPEPYRETARKQRLEREALPLFAEAVAAGQHGGDGRPPLPFPGEIR